MERNTRSRNDQRTTPISLGTAVRRILRQKLIVICSVLLFAVLGAIAGSLMPERYEAKTTVNAFPLVNNPGMSANYAAVDMDTEETVAASRVVLARAADKLGVTVSELDSGLDVAGHSDSTILDITVTSADPEKAATYANAIAEAYLANRQDTLEQSREELRKKITDGTSNFNKQVVDQAMVTLMASSTTGGTVISEAQVPGRSSGFSIAQTALIGAAAGLLIGIFAAYIADRSSRTLGYPERLSEIAGESVSLIEKDNEEEAARQLLRRIGAPEGDLETAGIKGITIFSPLPQAASALTDLLAGSLVTTTTFIDSNTFESFAMGDVKKHIEQSSPALVEADPSASTAKVLVASDASGVLLVPFTAKSTVKSATRLFDELSPKPGTQVIPVYFTSTSSIQK